MKVIGIVGSPRANGNTEILTAHTLTAISEEGINTELITLANLDIRPCTACMVCKETGLCSINDDLFPIYENVKVADGIIISSPVYFGSATALIKAFIERVGYLSRHRKEPFTGKVGGPLVVARRAGHNFTIAQLTLWYQILGMVVCGSTYWNVAFGRDRGDVANDIEGMKTVWNFGKNVASVLKKLQQG